MFQTKIGGQVLLPDPHTHGPVADGRLIPVLVIDTAGRPDIRERIRQHQHLRLGDARHQWATSRGDADSVMLLLTFERRETPPVVDMVLPFSIEQEGIVVESMIRPGAAYLQAGSEGDRLSATLDEPRVLVELPDSGFGSHWELLFEKRMTKVMATRMRVSRRKDKPVAKQLIAEMRKLTSMRVID